MEVTQEEYSVILTLLRSGRREEAAQLLLNNPQITAVNVEDILDNIIKNENISFPDTEAKETFKEAFMEFRTKDKWLFAGVVGIALILLVAFIFNFFSSIPARADLEETVVTSAAECETIITKGRRGTENSNTYITLPGMKRFRYVGPRPEDISAALEKSGKKTILISHDPMNLHEVIAHVSGNKEVTVMSYNESAAHLKRANKGTLIIIAVSFFFFLGLLIYEWRAIKKARIDNVY